MSKNKNIPSILYARKNLLINRYGKNIDDWPDKARNLYFRLDRKVKELEGKL